MNRRTLLKCLSGWLGAVCASVVGVPGVSFILDAMRRGRSPDEIIRRVARLKDLPIGKPVPVPISGSRLDAWTVHPNEVLGRVWVVRRKAEAVGDTPASDNVIALTATCPHLGCLIQHDPKEKCFVCPCHRAAFGLNGERLKKSNLRRENHAPRGMDALECRLVQDEATQEWWVEVDFQKFEQGLTQRVVKA